MNVTYYINTGTPCQLPTSISGVSIKESIQDFKDYIADCERFGSDYSNSSLEISCDHWSESRLYELGKRGGIIRTM